MGNSVVSSMSNSRENLLSSSSVDSEYTYENAIEDYKTRISRTPAPLTEKIAAKIQQHQQNFESSSPSSISKIPITTPVIRPEIKTKCLPNSNILKTQENFLRNTTITNNTTKEIPDNNQSDNTNVVPKIDIKQKKELFETQRAPAIAEKPKIEQKPKVNEIPITKTIKDRLTSLETKEKLIDDVIPVNTERIPETTMKLKDRVSSFERSASVTDQKTSPKIDVPIISLKDRLTSLQSNAIIYDDPIVSPTTIATPPTPTINSSKQIVNQQIPDLVQSPQHEKHQNDIHHVAASSPSSSSPMISSNNKQNYKSDDRCVILEFNGYNKPKNVENVCKSPDEKEKIIITPAAIAVAPAPPKIHNMTPKIVEVEPKVMKQQLNIVNMEQPILPPVVMQKNVEEKVVDVIEDKNYHLENGDDQDTSVSNFMF